MQLRSTASVEINSWARPGARPAGAPTQGGTRFWRSSPAAVTAAGSPRTPIGWDGTQTGFDLDADHLFGEMADELLYHGDVNSALRQMMQNGLTDRDGRDMEGLRDMMQRLRERRREILENHNLGGVYDDIAESLRDVVETERNALNELTQPDDSDGSAADERQQQLQNDTAAMKNLELDMLPPISPVRSKACRTMTSRALRLVNSSKN